MLNTLKTKHRNIIINEGNPFSLVLKFRNTNTSPITYLSLTGYNFKAQIRSLPDLESTLLQEITCTVQGINNTELLLSIPVSNLLVPNIAAYNIPPNVEYLSKDKLPDSAYYWSLRSFDSLSNPLSRILEGCVLVSSETTNNF